MERRSFLTLFQAALLGLVQGLTEFLPVSSSGHLVLFQAFLGIEDGGIIFEVMVHFGTLLAVVTVFWHDIINLIRELFLFFKPATYRAGLMSRFESENARLLFYIIIGTLPAAVIGLLFEDYVEAAFQNAKLTCVMLIVTGFILLLTRLVRKKSLALSSRRSFLIGVAQACAILPGISRSGSTISAALYQGVDSNRAAQFSFLLALPAILGATVLKLAELFSQPIDSTLSLNLILGTVVSYGSGYLAIKLLLGIVRRGKLYWFAPYCFLIAIAGLIWL